MTAKCSGACASPPFRKRSNTTPYGDGWRYCKQCDRAINYSGLYCPCCRLRLRARAR